MCNCQVCTDHRRWHAALNPHTEEAKLVFDELMSRIACAETDATYYRMKFEGTWDRHSQQHCEGRSNG